MRIVLASLAVLVLGWFVVALIIASPSNDPKPEYTTATKQQQKVEADYATPATYALLGVALGIAAARLSRPR